MHSIRSRSHVGSDGILQRQVPIGYVDKDLEVIVIYQPIDTEMAKTPDELGYLPNFFERTAGSIPNLERPSQGELAQYS